MARIKRNPILDRISGAIGELVFRHQRGRTVLSRKGFSDRPPSEAQVAHRQLFRQASAYAVAAMEDPDASDYYAPVAERRELTVYTAAIADFLTPPTIVDIDVGAYLGLSGDLIEVDATDDAGVDRVEVTIVDHLGDVVEEGEAVLDGFRWVYTAQTTVEDATTVEVEARAFDRPGHFTSKTVEVILPG